VEVSPPNKYSIIYFQLIYRIAKEEEELEEVERIRGSSR